MPLDIDNYCDDEHVYVIFRKKKTTLAEDYVFATGMGFVYREDLMPKMVPYKHLIEDAQRKAKILTKEEILELIDQQVDEKLKALLPQTEKVPRPVEKQDLGNLNAAVDEKANIDTFCTCAQLSEHEIQQEDPNTEKTGESKDETPLDRWREAQQDQPTSDVVMKNLRDSNSLVSRLQMMLTHAEEDYERIKNRVPSDDDLSSDSSVSTDSTQSDSDFDDLNDTDLDVDTDDEMPHLEKVEEPDDVLVPLEEVHDVNGHDVLPQVKQTKAKFMVNDIKVTLLKYPKETPSDKPEEKEKKTGFMVTFVKKFKETPSDKPEEEEKEEPTKLIPEEKEEPTLKTLKPMSERTKEILRKKYGTDDLEKIGEIRYKASKSGN